MSRYHFHLREDVDVDDEEGVDLPDLDAARERALESAREIVCAHIREYGNVNLDHAIHVADETGATLFTVTFREAFTVTGRDGD